MELNNNYTSIEIDVYVDIEKAIHKDLDADTVFVCHGSNHPDDGYLYRYIAKRANDKYIVGLANTSRPNGVSLYENHYDLDFKTALEVLAEHIHVCGRKEEN